MDRWNGKVAVVTGASAGIGLSITKILVRNGMIVIGLARREEKMRQEMKNAEGPGEFHAKKCDVTKEAEVIEAFDYVRRTFKSLSVLINNAGSVNLNTIEAAETAELSQVIALNFMGPLYCSKQGIKLMKENSDEGHIININSIAGHKVIHPSCLMNTHTNVYSPSKFALTALSEVLTNELLGSKIRVTNLSPGLVITEVVQNAVDKSTGIIHANPALQPDDIANAIVFVLGTPVHVQITQLTIKPLGEPY
ncbi:farnesol dehydrogenase-like [Phymastichus coffea]|uniref:farnesol dehydrogenase-like n=1 Tax=Phymastichus coffea TaxID=108790 RepID=UPI00273AA74A|nr:farnesol dehydrogenase-like [Phymastichus coffea]